LLRIVFFIAGFSPVGAALGGEVFINELHYDNTGADTGEGLEVAAPAGTDLAGYQLIFYNGSNGSPYATETLSGTVNDQMGTGSGVKFFPVSGVQNGAPDGVVLFNSGTSTVEQFLSYEGQITAVSGVAAGMTSTDIGVGETGSTPVGQSLQLKGTGSRAEDFMWVPASAASPGAINEGQTLVGIPVFRIVLEVGTPSFSEDAGDMATTVTVSLLPVPGSEVTLSLEGSDPGEATVPSSVTVGVTGVATFAVGAVVDGIPDGDQVVIVAAEDPAGTYRGASSMVVVNDVDGTDLRQGSFRLASYNIENGVGQPGSAKFEAARRILERIDADVIAFQEMSAGDDFGNLRALVDALGFGTGRSSLATDGDVFAGQTYVGGDFPSDQYVALASRFPITSAAQIGRGAGGVREITRYPLFATVAVPGSTEDVAFVVVHYKAGSRDADRFRKAVEGYRTREFLEGQGIDGIARNVFVLGDFNEDINDRQDASYSTAIGAPASHMFPDGSMLPVSFGLGADISGALAIDIPYARFPDSAFAPVGTSAIPALQVNGSDRTRNDLSPRRIDYLMVSDFTRANGNTPAEIYNTALEAVSVGLPKEGAPLAAALDRAASDHHLLFGDFALSPVPAISISFDREFFYEDAGAGAATGVVTLPAAPGVGESLEVLLGFIEDGEAAISARTLSFAGGEISQTFQLDALADGVADPDRLLYVGAAAAGYSTGYGTVVSRNLEAAGQVVITQYSDPVSGSSRRAIEVLNAGAEAVDFFITPLQVRLYRNGSQEFISEVFLEQGRLPAGEVLVIGDSAMGDYLVAEGLLPGPGTSFDDAFNGTLFTGAGGAAVFLKDPFTYNGDDALEVLLDYRRSDVFGTVGDDPGTSWAGGGVMTRDSNIERKASALQGVGGFTNPGELFDVVTEDGSLTGFGLPPVAGDPFGDWAESFGLVGEDALPSADPDADGRVNLLEYALITPPDQGFFSEGNGVDLISGGGVMVLSVRRRSPAPELGFGVEISVDLETWEPADITPETLLPDMVDGTQTDLWELPGSVESTRFVRLRVEIF